MKTLLILSAVIFFTSSQIRAQEDESLVNNDNQNTSYASYSAKMSKRENRVERRKLNEADVSYDTRQQFIVDFGNIPVDSWKSTALYDEATFTKDGKVLTAIYDDESNLVGTSSDKTLSDLPIKAQYYISKKYPDYTVSGVVFFDDNEFNHNNAVLYNQPTNGEDSYFVELTSKAHTIVLQASLNGDLSFFKNIR